MKPDLLCNIVCKRCFSYGSKTASLNAYRHVLEQLAKMDKPLTGDESSYYFEAKDGKLKMEAWFREVNACAGGPGGVRLVLKRKGFTDAQLRDLGK